MNLIEFVDNDSLTNFESVLVQLAPKEAVIGFSSSQSEESAVLKKVTMTSNGLEVLKSASKPPKKSIILFNFRSWKEMVC
jgi:hypothetical protein